MQKNAKSEGQIQRQQNHASDFQKNYTRRWLRGTENV